MYFDNNEAKGSKWKGHDIYLQNYNVDFFSVEQGPFNKVTCLTNTPCVEGRGNNYALLGTYDGSSTVYEIADENWLLRRKGY